MQPLRIALAQIAPRLRALDENLARHHELLGEARDKDARLFVFPELGLTGYQLQDLAGEVARRLDDRRLAELAGAAGDLSEVRGRGPLRGHLVRGGVGRPPPVHLHRLFEDGDLRNVRRKPFLPTCGLFDERRSFAGRGGRSPCSSTCVAAPTWRWSLVRVPGWSEASDSCSAPLDRVAAPLDRVGSIRRTWVSDGHDPMGSGAKWRDDVPFDAGWTAPSLVGASAIQGPDAIGRD